MDLYLCVCVGIELQLHREANKQKTLNDNPLRKRKSICKKKFYFKVDEKNNFFFEFEKKLKEYNV